MSTISNRNDYRTWDRSQVEADVLATWERLRINGVPVSQLVDEETGRSLPLGRLDYETAVDRLGLTLVTAQVTYETDSEGNPVLDDKGKPVVLTMETPVYDIDIQVKVEGLSDCEGTPIPKGKQFFILTKQPANRPINKTNVMDLAKRLDRWMLNGETLIKDEHGSGQNEQHRCAAVVVDRLTGANLAPPEGIPVLMIDGVSRGASGSIDTGKQKSATDDLASNHELLPSPRSLRQWKDPNNPEVTGYGSQEKIMRTKVLKEVQGVSKRIILRMLGFNIKASRFSGYESAGNAMTLATQWVGLDEMIDLVYAYVTDIPMKDPATKQPRRPCSIWQVATAYALYSLRQSPTLDSVESLSEYPFPEIDLAPLQQFLEHLHAAGNNLETPLSAWAADRVTPGVLRATKSHAEGDFASVLLALRQYLETGSVDVSCNRADAIGKTKQTSQVFSHFGGGDRGPKPKASKVKQD